MFFKKYNVNEIVNVNKIGIIMFGLMGDVILRTPVLKALKKLYPEATIVALVDPIGYAVLEYNSLVDEVLILDRNKEKNKLKQNLKKIKAIFRVRKQKFDLIVNLYNAGVSRPMVLFSGARYKLGFCKQKNKFLYNVKNECKDNRLKEAQSLYNYMISIVEPLSKKKYSLKPIFEVPQSALEKMNSYLQTLNYAQDKIYILNLGASKEDKILEFEKYLYIVQYIYEQYKFIPMIISNPGQEYLQTRFIKEYLQKQKHIPYIKLPSLKLQDVAALIQMTKFIITPDTGLMHLAMCFDNYIMTIFTYTHPIFVDPNNNRFISVYEHFNKDVYYQKQNISKKNLQKAIIKLFSAE